MAAPLAASLAALRAELAAWGLDADAVFAKSAYDAAAPSHALPPAGDLQDSACVLVGSGAALFGAVAANLAEGAPGSLELPAAPVDAHVEAGVAAAAAAAEAASCGALPAGSSVLRFAHDRRPDRLVAMQRLAAVTGAYRLDQDAMLALHPAKGQWCALRAAVVLAAPPDACDELRGGPPPPAAFQLPNAPRPEVAQEHFQRAMRGEAGGWLKLREALSPNHPAKYPDEQIAYFYHSDRQALARRVAAIRRQAAGAATE